MGSSWQHNTIAGLNGFAHKKFLNWLFGEVLNYRWDEKDKTFVFYFTKDKINNEIKTKLKNSYEKRFLVKINTVD